MTPPPSADGLMTGLVTKSEKSPRGGDVSGKAKALFWFSVLVHIILIGIIIISSLRGGTINLDLFYYLAIFLFLILIVWATMVFHQEGHFVDMKQIVVFSIISIIYVIIPLLLRLIPQIPLVGNTYLHQWVLLLLVLFPIWPLVIGFKAGIPIAAKWVSFWIVILLLAFIVIVVVKVRPSAIASKVGTPGIIDAGGAFEYLAEELADAAKIFWKKINPSKLIPQIINATGINYYTGMIDNNEKAPVGLYLENVRLADKYAYEGYPVIIWADIRGKSFVDEIGVTPSCYIDKKGYGETDPRSITIFGEEHLTLSCTFYDLTKGSYLAKVSAPFNFETWAYVTYTFVDIETKRALELQGKNVNYELDVDHLPRAVFTNGPVMLGMASMVDQPVGIDTMYNIREPILGVTLDNLWTEGEIERVDEFIIQVPDDFKLVKCDRWRPDTERQPSKSEEGYDFYTFSREELGDPRLGFQSVTCRLHINDPKELLAGAQKVQRTFVAQAKYLYKLEKSVRIYVRE